jgi:hypothetical protein
MVCRSTYLLIIVLLIQTAVILRAQTQHQSNITQSIGSSHRISLPGSANLLARAEFDQGCSAVALGSEGTPIAPECKGSRKDLRKRGE